MGSHADDQNTDVIRRMFASLTAGDYDEMAARFAEDIEFDLPYARQGSLAPFVGRGPVKDLLTEVFDGSFDRFAIEVDTMYPGADGETIVVEYRSKGIYKHDGSTYANRYVGIFRVRAGAIVFWREYHNPEAVTSAIS